MVNGMAKKILYGLLVVVFACSIGLPFAQPVYASTQDRAIQGEGSQAEGTYYPGDAPGGGYTNLNSDDGDTSIVYLNPAALAYLYHCYDMVNFAESYVAGSISVTLYVKAKRAIDPFYTPYVRIAGTNYYGTQIYITTDYVTYTKTWAGNPAGGVWTAASLNAAEFGFRNLAGGAGGILYVTYMYITVTYTPPPPTVTTNAASSIAATTATGNGNITNIGGSAPTTKGICYSSINNPPTTADSKVYETGTFGVEAITESLTGLSSGTKYYDRAYAINASGTGYGSVDTFLTLPNAPTSLVATSELSQVSLTWTNASGGSGTTIYTQIQYSTSGYPATYSDNITGVSWTTGTSGTVSPLVNGTLYYFSAFSKAVNGGLTQYSTAYATVQSTPQAYASVSVSAASLITGATATLNGDIDNLNGGGDCDYYGFVWGMSDFGNPGIATAPADGAGGWTKGWNTGPAAYGVASYSHGITSLLPVTTYYCRFAAHNAVGWSYSSAISFATIVGSPSISTQAASNIATTTARINASGIFDGGEACTVEWVYVAGVGPYANYAAIDAAGGDVHVNAVGTYITGQLPYYDLSGLATSTTYWFCASITNADSTQYASTPYSFVTSSGVGNISHFTAIPTDTTISLAWVKDDGASNTWIKYSISDYPPTTASGTYLYVGTGNSYLFQGLTEGTNYYFSGWGLTAGIYSDNVTMVMATTLASIPTNATLPPPTTPSSWSLTPSTSSISNVPFFTLVNFFSDAYEIPNATMWYGLAIFFSVGMGLFMYWRGNKNLLASIMVTALGLFVGAIIGLVYLWIGVFFCVIAAAMAWLAQRY